MDVVSETIEGLQKRAYWYWYQYVVVAASEASLLSLRYDGLAVTWTVCFPRNADTGRCRGKSWSKAQTDFGYFPRQLGGNHGMDW